jgi:hypothetical protein
MASQRIYPAGRKANSRSKVCRSLCHACSSIDVAQVMRPEGYNYHKCLKEWLESIATCQLCRLIFDTCHNTDSDLLDLFADPTRSCDYRVVLQWPYTKSSGGYESHPCLGFLLRHHTSGEEFWKPVKIPVFADAGDIAATHGMKWRRKLPANTGSKSSMKLAKTWLEECLIQHDVDNVTPSTMQTDIYAASKLLEITDSCVRAISASGIRKPYATLSYCWGTGCQWPWGPTQIERHDLDAKVASGLLRNALPKTIRDAVSVTEQLGLEYLWIDVLCISQDDTEFTRESVKMADIYSQACVNLAASSSTSNAAGLFNKRSRSQDHHYSDCLKVNLRFGDGTSTLYFCRYGNFSSDPYQTDFPETIQHGPEAYLDEVERGPLAQRAWVCQERMCSPRTIYFGDTQLFWHCRHLKLAEDNLDLRVLAVDDKVHDPAGWRAYLSRYVSTGMHDDDNQRLSYLWYSLLIPKHYSKRDLTYHSDKLIAISGLAKQIQRRWPNMTYVAGLWSSTLLEGLLWISETTTHRITPYVAPSWSWASRHGEIQYGYMGAANMSFQCDVIRWNVTHSDSDQFSPITSATLEIEAAGLPGLVPRDRIYPQLRNQRLELDTGAKGEVFLDDDWDLDLPVYALLLRQDFVGAYFLLVIESDGGQGEFKRVGMGSITRAEVSGNPMNCFVELPKTPWVLV